VPSVPPTATPGGDRAAAIHHAALTLAPHIDVRPDFNDPGNDAGGETIDQLDLPKLERGDLDVATLALFAETHKRTPENLAAARACRRRGGPARSGQAPALQPRRDGGGDASSVDGPHAAGPYRADRSAKR
jgi:hypothetical protein